MTRSIHRNLIRTVLLLSALIGAPSGLVAQQQPEGEGDAAPAEAFVETIDVRLINIDVYVTDRKGNPITGLTREDFRLFVDGRPARISNFYAVSGGEPIGSSAPAAAETTPDSAAAPEPEAGSTTAAPPPAPTPGAPGLAGTRETPPESQQLQLVVYVDNVNIAPLNRNRVFRALRQFLYENVRPGDRVMLLSYDRTLNVRQPFTSDPQAIARALIDLETLSGQASSTASQREELMRQIEDAQSAAEVSGRIHQYAQSVRNDLRFTLDALSESVRSLAGLPGRKILLYVSDGLPMAPGRDLFFALQYRFDERTALSGAMEFDQSRSFRELTNLANANRVAFYTVDAKGLTLPGGYAAEYRGGSYESDWRTAVADLEQNNLQNSIRMMAERTGGRAIINTNDIGPGLERLAEDLENYYSLGYQPAQTGDGRYHEIEVEVLRDGVTVRHREGYREKSLSTRMAETIEAKLRYGAGGNPMQLRIEMGAAAPHQDNQYLLPVSVKIPLDQLTLVPRQDIWVGRALVYFGTMNSDGKLSEVASGQVDVTIPASEYEQALAQNWSYDAQLLVRRGTQRLAVGVQDQLGARSSVVGRTFQVGS